MIFENEQSRKENPRTKIAVPRNNCKSGPYNLNDIHLFSYLRFIP